MQFRRQTLFHQSHFDWDLERFSVPDVRRRRPTRKPACRYWAWFLRPLYSSFADHILVRGTVTDSGCDLGSIERYRRLSVRNLVLTADTPSGGLVGSEFWVSKG